MALALQEKAEQLLLLPESLRTLFNALPQAERCQVEELRLRLGQAPAIVLGGEELCPPAWQAHRVSERELAWVLEAAGEGSLHMVMEQLRAGFLPAKGGARIGICGSVARQEGAVRNFRFISSLALRFAREVSGLAEPLLGQLLAESKLQSTLILSPPGGGKTTLLRELIRCISDGVGLAPLRVGVADERGELAGLQSGRPQRSLGARTDILDGCPKAEALLMLLRGMNPQVLAADEITAAADIHAMEEVAGCGVTLLATAHGSRPEELLLRPLYRHLLQSGIFRRYLCIELRQGRRVYRVYREEDVSLCCR